MTILFSRGQRGRLADLGCGAALTAAVTLEARGMAVDVSCFGLDAADKLADERYLVFYNQPASPLNAIRLENAAAGTRFHLDLAAVPASIAKLTFVATIDGEGSLRALGASAFRLDDAMEFPFSGADFQDEKAVIIGEIYRKDGQWRCGAVGQGFNGGLAALLSHFGGVETVQASPPSPASPSPAASASPPQAAPAAPTVSLSKVTLEKRGDKVSLQKRDGEGFGRIQVNLNWNRGMAAGTTGAPPTRPGFLGRLMGGATAAPAGIDLDLGCLYELQDGSTGLVQALGNAWGAFERRPFIHLPSDDRTGASADGENLFINGASFDQIKRVLIFTFIYEGVADWAATDAVVTINAAGQAPVEVRLDQGGGQRMCAIALLENRGGNAQVTKLIDYFAQAGNLSAHELMDRKYRFGLRWSTGRKD